MVGHYDDWLTEQGWTRGDGPTDIQSTLGASWWRDGRSVVLMTLWDLEGRDLVILVLPSEGEA